MRELLFRGFHPCDGPEIIVVDGEVAALNLEIQTVVIHGDFRLSI